MRHHLSLSIFVLAVAAAPAYGQAPSPAPAETGVSPRQVLIRLGSAAGQAGGGAGLSNVGEVLADLIGLEISNAPLGSSAGGFTFAFDPASRTFSRAAPSFGPSFSDRAVTAGVGRASVGLNFIRATYDSLDGHSLSGGSLQTIALNDANGRALFTGQADLSVTTETVVLFTNIALNDRLDVGLALPYVRLQIQGQHVMGLDVLSGQGAASGLGDVALRAKLRVIEQPGGGVALALDARLPTGDKEALLGSGVTRTLVSGIWSSVVGDLSPHVSGGFEYWANPFLVRDPLTGANVAAGRHAFRYEAGVDWVASDRVTLTSELLGRWLRDGARLQYVAVDVRHGNPFGITSALIAAAVPAGLHRTSIAAGVKWNAAGSVLLTGSILVPIREAGLKDRFTPVLGLDWGF